MANPRPPLRRPKVLWLACAFVLVVAGASGPWPQSGIAAVALMAILALALGGAWLLSPWSRTARNVVLPDLDTFDRRVAFSRRVAGALGRIPVLGSVWRAGQRLTQGTVDRAIEEQRRTIDDFYGRPEANDKA